MLKPKLLKTCDNCKLRKVRCTGSRQPSSMPCGICLKRGVTCSFSENKRRTKATAEPLDEAHTAIWPLEKASTDGSPQGVVVDRRPLDRPEQPQTQSQSACFNDAGEWVETPVAPSRAGPNRIYMDEMLKGRGIEGKEFHASLFPKSEKQKISSSSLSLFSDSDIRSISEKLRNAPFGALIESFSDSMNKRLHRQANKVYPEVSFRPPPYPIKLSPEQKAEHIRCYFDHIHPLFPFLMKAEFEQQVLDHHSEEALSKNTPLFALYNAMLTIGSQLNGHGSFEPGEGASWQFFQLSLSRLGELIASRPGVLSVQALLAMFLFAMTYCGGQIAEMLLSEAARMTQFCRLNKGSKTITDGAHQRTFWVIYSIEKLSASCQGRPSVIPDEDIGCHIPFIPEAIFGDFNWFLSSVRFGRLLSKAQSALFSVSATTKPLVEYQQDLQLIRHELETWRLSIPPPFRPGERFARARLGSSASIMAALRTHLVYHDFVMVLCRLSLQIGEPESGRGPLNARETFMRSTRRVIELIGHLEIEPYTPSVLLTVIPLSAFLSLFHLVIDNPRHVETRDNLNFLDIAAGFFRRLEYVTNQEFPFSVFPKLASIVQNYVQTLLPMEETATPLVQSLMSSLPENDPPSEVELDISGSSNMVIPKGTMGVYQAPSDSCETIYMMNEGSAMETMRFEVDGTALDPDGVHGVPDNEVMDFFGNLLDGPFWLYGNEPNWQ
ncbi:uncharacterized protein PV06_02883 [Exophiala oligosperma]|uniref:Zn(2)-C6 fungal-type domain-containing protein n=1 Tax=Exophiala oligosperma TaxID=215243 RepID=A0A0D2AX89_9EURO|nr:uncharacterized protein PV06_02883 [Exophiala oligosperma]KIW44411.1 hypothetical protein PV06_02883 [Exophiala oligosperma]